MLASYAIWDREPVTMTANEAVRASHGGGEGKLSEAEAFLKDELAHGPVDADAMLAKAADANISRATLRRAKGKLKVAAVKSGFASGWAWELPQN